ncbi:MMPL family transporter [Pediococcus ethanolidurans]|uniref:MMPL family transporter n=1 Tax=Pediococcus ethanolidurans TaxID=319653 RepID=UPI0021AA6DC0|nr:MMPL family transporter [Pediococcus ethanolidurans]MCT4397916.1 transporter [Pediococcus ethanolidurans]MCV3320912.1 MMPL family transporter [Pediococcus ethanolidurans]MCV3323629.1 MMPL family transporter [Pediococcus ethanolidurans]MCV3327356.1 MMPL family transporter [Pediococcus ethanolidurans]MCV3554477.1 MMPL family transporter [Pediococcus ethanolidurans]
MQKLVKNHGIALIVWIGIILISIFSLPNIDQLVRSHGDTKIPSAAQSQIANRIQSKWGYGQGNTTQVVAIFNNGNQKLTADQKENINSTINYLRDNKKKLGIKDIKAASDNAETRKQLISKDKSTELVQVLVSKSHGSYKTIDKELTKAVKTPNVKSYITGGDILNEKFSEATQAGVKKTEIIAAIFIFIVLILVFQSPIVPLISVFTVGVSFITTLSIVTNLVSRANFPFSNFTQVFIVVVLFGIGTDYNILLYDQFKEQLSKGEDRHTASQKALHTAGRTILYSGSSVFIGFLALGLAKFSIYKSSVGVALGVAVLIVVLLTLNPFFMHVLGKKMFWPSKKFDGHSQSKMWHALANSSILHPIIALALVLLLTVPFVVTGSGTLNYDNLDELSNTLPEKIGFNVVKKHFSAGTAEPSTLYIRSNKRLDNEETLKLVDQITKQLQKEKGIKTVASATQPGGSAIGKLYVKGQVKTVTTGIDKAHTGLNTIGKGLTSASDQLAGTNMSSGLNSVQQLINGTEVLRNGSLKITAGANKLSSGASQISSGVSSMSSQMSPLISGLNQYAGGVNTLSSGLSLLNSNSSQLTDGSQELLTSAQKLSTGVSTLNSDAVQIDSQLDGLQQTLSAGNSAMSSLSGSVKQLNSLKSELARSQNAINSLEQLAPLLTKLESAKENLSAVNSSFASLDKVSSALTSAATDSAQADASNKAALKTLSRIDKSTMSTDDKNKLATAESQIKKADASAQTIKKTTGETLSGLSSGLSSVKTQVASLEKKLKSVNIDSNTINELKQLETVMSKAESLMSSTNISESQLNQLTALGTQLKGASSSISKLKQFTAGVEQLNTQVNKNSALVNGVSKLNGGLNKYANSVQLAASGASTLSGKSSELTGGVGKLTSGVGTLTTSLDQLSSGASTLAGSTPALTSGLDQEVSGQKQMYSTLKGLSGKVTKLQSGLKTAADGTKTIGSGMTTANSYLNGMGNSSVGKTFYIPASQIHGKSFKPVLKTYYSEDRKATKLTIVLDSNPASGASMAKVKDIQQQVKNDLRGTSLKNATVAVGGQTAQTADINKVAGSDFTRTAAIMIVGILIALMFVTRSILMPFYIIGTLLLAYYGSLGITKAISNIFLGQSMLTWNTPFFGFIMIIALGVDYSIFLMMKYRDFNKSLKPSKRILEASGIIGAVVLSAMIILSGTFAAMIPSGVLTLIQVALVVIIGLIILIIIIPVLLPSLIKLTYEGISFKKKKNKH